MEQQMLGKFRLLSHLLWHRRGNLHGQGRILRTLLENGSLSQKALADLLNLRPASLCEALAKLEAQELVTREKDESDRRSVIISLTPAGRETAEEVRRDREVLAEKLFGTLTESEKNTLNACMDKLIPVWEKEMSQSEEETSEEK